MNLPKIYFDDTGGIAVRAQFQDTGEWVTYAVKIDILDYIHLIGWIRKVLQYDKFILSEDVKNWLIVEMKEHHPEEVQKKLDEEYSHWEN